VLTNVDSEDATMLSVYSPFKKKTVDQELFIGVSPKEPFQLAKLYKNGASDKAKVGQGNKAVYLTLSKCYIYCVLERPLEVTLQCKGGSEVTATIPAHSSPSSDPIKFFVAEADESDGSFLYYKPKYSIITNID